MQIIEAGAVRSAGYDLALLALGGDYDGNGLSEL